MRHCVKISGLSAPKHTAWLGAVGEVLPAYQVRATKIKNTQTSHQYFKVIINLSNLTAYKLILWANLAPSGEKKGWCSKNENTVCVVRGGILLLCQILLPVLLQVIILLPKI